MLRPADLMRSLLLTSVTALVLLAPGPGAYAQSSSPLPPADHPAGAGVETERESPAVPDGFVSIPNPAFPPSAAVANDLKRGRRYDAQDLMPYFGSGTLYEARLAFDGGHYPHAIELLQGQGDSPPVRYLRALTQLRMSQYAAASEAMVKLAHDYPAMRDRCLSHAALAEELQGNWRKSAEIFGQIPSTSRLYADARFGVARAQRHLGDRAGAIATLGPVVTLAGNWGRDVGAEALIVRADLSRELKDAKGERENLAKLWASHPLSGLAAQAERRLKGAALPNELTVTRGETLIDLHRNKPGMALLQPLLSKLKLPDPLACRAHFAYGKALRKERDHKKALEVLRPVVEKCRAPDFRPRVMYVLGSSESIVDQGHGQGTYELLAKDYPQSNFADDALFFAADLYEKNGDFASALQRLAELADRYPKGDFYAEALFRMFWIHRRQEEKDEALKALDRIEKDLASNDESFDVERERYWRARMAADAGDPKAALNLYEHLVLEHPATYYGLMAREKLREADPARAAAVDVKIYAKVPDHTPWPLYAGAMGEDPHFLSGLELFRLGFADVAGGELMSVNRTGQSEDALRLLVHVIAATGDFRSAHAIARVSLRRDLSGPVRPETRSLWELAYPNAFRDLIEKHCKEVSLDPDLLQGLMREESALDPKVLSWAGALGLTQLMLPTAKATAAQLKLKVKVTPESLQDPDLNIQLGAAYLAKLVQTFNGNKQYALAGYNAGAGAVNKWRAERRNLALDEWVEEIPIAETRGYVKRVLRTYNTYRLLYGRAAPASAPVKTAAQR